MIRKLLACALVVLVAQTQLAVPALAATKAGKNLQSPADVKLKLDRAGIGERARVTVWTKAGAKTKGYVSERREAEFVVRDRKTDAPTIISYDDVTKLDINRGHSTARNVTIGVVAGVRAVLLTLGLLIASLDD